MRRRHRDTVLRTVVGASWWNWYGSISYFRLRPDRRAGIVFHAEAPRVYVAHWVLRGIGKEIHTSAGERQRIFTRETLNARNVIASAVVVQVAVVGLPPRKRPVNVNGLSGEPPLEAALPKGSYVYVVCTTPEPSASANVLPKASLKNSEVALVVTRVKYSSIRRPLNTFADVLPPTLSCTGLTPSYRNAVAVPLQLRNRRRPTPS